MVGGLEGLVRGPDVEGLASPVDREVDLADLLERLRSVLEPGGDLAVPGVRADDRLDVVIEHCEAALDAVHPPFVAVGHRPSLGARRLGTQGVADLVGPGAVKGDALGAQGRSAGDRVELEVVDGTVE
ncbi:MAG: hypothetical protein WBB28_24050, partial [Crinalium sp.]